jgi:hypothetical protein
VTALRPFIAEFSASARKLEAGARMAALERFDSERKIATKKQCPRQLVRAQDEHNRGEKLAALTESGAEVQKSVALGLDLARLSGGRRERYKIRTASRRGGYQRGRVPSFGQSPPLTHIMAKPLSLARAFAVNPVRLRAPAFGVPCGRLGLIAQRG